jgi:sulfur carrier protein
MIKVNGKNVDWHEGMTVSDALDAMGFTFYLITVTIDGDHVPQDDYATRTIPDGADVKAIHIHHGG